MRKFAIYAGTAMLAMMLCGNVEAGAVDLLGINDGPDNLEDVDYESFVDLGAAGPSAGDVFIGIFTLEFVNGTETSGAGATFSGLLVARVKSVTGGGRIEFEAVSASEYDDLSDGTGALGAVTGALMLPTRADASSALLVYDDTSSPFIDPGANVANTDWSGVKTAITTAVDGTKVIEFGFTGTTYAEAQLTSGGNFDFALALNVTDNNIWPMADVTSADSGIFDLDSTFGSDIALPDAQLHVGGETDQVDSPTAPNNNRDTGAFNYRTDADLYINPVPEPGSMTLLGLGALGLLGGRMRRRNAA